MGMFASITVNGVNIDCYKCTNYYEETYHENEERTRSVQLYCNGGYGYVHALMDIKPTGASDFITNELELDLEDGDFVGDQQITLPDGSGYFRIYFDTQFYSTTFDEDVIETTPPPGEEEQND